jgi:hypothetical protein
MLTIAVAAASAFTASSLSAQENCRHEARREATVDVASAARLAVEVGAGSLRVEGRQGVQRVRVSGRACASSEDLLDQLRVEATRDGGTVRVRTPEIRQQSWSGRQYARLDLVIEVPAGMEADVRDGSGSAELLHLGRLSVRDGSGSLHIEDIDGGLTVHDGTGEIHIANVRGDVDIEDGSGEIEVADVTGSVTLDDGSGSITVADVGRDVRVTNDGSGGVDVRRVGGDLVVKGRRASGIRYSDVRGTVVIPVRRDRRGR